MGIIWSNIKRGKTQGPQMAHAALHPSWGKQMQGSSAEDVGGQNRPARKGKYNGKDYTDRRQTHRETACRTLCGFFEKTCGIAGFRGI